MTNYDMDELERRNLLVQHHQERERKSRGIRPEDEDHSVEIELPHKYILKLALLAHEKDVTLNVFINDVLKQGIKDGEYRFEHDVRPELLNETE